MAVGLTVIKKFTYRGDANEEYSNQYWFTGATPADGAAWRALFDALVAQEKTLLGWTTTIKGYGYDDPSPTANSIWSVDLRNAPNTTVAGTLVVGATGIPAPGDDAVWCRWKTNRLTIKGKPIYLRKYYHPAIISTSGGDTVLAAQVTALNAFATKMRDGSFLDGRTLTDRNHTDTLVSSSASAFVTTRTLKRRGKRPNS